MAEAESRVLPIRESFKVLGLGRNKGYEMVAEGTFPVRVIRFGSRMYVSTVELDRFLTGDLNEQPQEAVAA